MQDPMSRSVHRPRSGSRTRAHTAVPATVCIALAIAGCAQDQDAGEVTAAASAAVTSTAAATFSSGSATSLTAGNAHTCALVGGGVQCWGKNADGQLGNGSTVDTFQRSWVTGLTSGVYAVAAGGSHTCAIVNGGVQCWGDDSHGQIGDGPVGNDNTPLADRRTPVAVTGLADSVQAISGGNSHTCAMINGRARCWGNNDFGQLGNGDPTNRDSHSPVDVGALSQGGVQAIAAGGSHTCAIVDGSARCWGFNGNGQLGNATPESPVPGDSNTPVLVTGLGGGVQAIAAGATHTCALVNGGVQCWGNNASGQIGNGVVDGNPVRSPFRLTDPDLMTGVRAIIAGQNHTCALVAGGAVKCWGDNSISQLGNGPPTAPNPTPSLVRNLSSGAAAIATGYQHTCAVTSDGTRCWGANGNGQLALNPNSGGWSEQPLLISGLTGLTDGVQAVAAGIHTCAIINGRTQCWGGNSFGQLGYNETSDSRLPGLVGGLPNGIAAIAAGGYHTCALVNGAVQCWGRNVDGQLGNNTNADSHLPGPVSGLSSGVLAIASGVEHTCAIVKGGAKCWGYNALGQLGNGSKENSVVPVTVSNIPSGAQAIGSGSVHSCALINGGVQCWGDNSWGQLGTGNHTGSLTPTPVQGLSGGVQALSVGALHNCAIVNGGAKCWGYGFSGELGNNTPDASLMPVDVIGLATGVQAIAAGYDHTCAVVNGGLWCWGSNSRGALGNNSSSRSLEPLQVPGLSSGIQSLTAGNAHTCAVTATGLRCWGDNFTGQVGDNSTQDRYVPVSLFWNASACADGGIEQNFGDGMVGCAGSRTFATGPALCGPGYRRASASEWVALRRGVAPTHNYWTVDSLRLNGTSSSSCFASILNGSSCGTAPARICVSDGTDPEGNTCSLTHCGLETNTPDQFLGGCTGNPSAGAVCVPSTGCADGSVEQVFENGVVGCAGAVTFPNRATLCGPGYRPAMASEWTPFAGRGSGVPTHNYWTDDALRLFDQGPGSCWAVTAAGTDCGTTTPMRVCTGTGTDAEGNACNRTHCGIGFLPDEYFGGCGNITAGTLCVRASVP